MWCGDVSKGAPTRHTGFYKRHIYDRHGSRSRPWRGCRADGRGAGTRRRLAASGSRHTPAHETCSRRQSPSRIPLPQAHESSSSGALSRLARTNNIHGSGRPRRQRRRARMPRRPFICPCARRHIAVQSKKEGRRSVWGWPAAPRLPAPHGEGGHLAPPPTRHGTTSHTHTHSLLDLPTAATHRDVEEIEERSREKHMRRREVSGAAPAASAPSPRRLCSANNIPLNRRVKYRGGRGEREGRG